MLPKHEHGLPAFLVQLLKQEKRLLFEPETAFLIAVNDVERVLPPIIHYVITFESLSKERKQKRTLLCQFKGVIRTTGKTTLQGSSILTRKLLKISTCGSSLSPLKGVSPSL